MLVIYWNLKNMLNGSLTHLDLQLNTSEKKPYSNMDQITNDIGLTFGLEGGHIIV